MDGPPDRWSSRTETLLMYAARSDHLERAIEPALARGAAVLCDRFHDSTRAYQGAGGGVDPAFIAALEAAVVAKTTPDLTFILDIDPDAGLARARLRGGAARFESRDLAFHARLREAFLAIAAHEPARCVVIDARQDPDATAAQVRRTLAERLPDLVAPVRGD